MASSDSSTENSRPAVMWMVVVRDSTSTKRICSLWIRISPPLFIRLSFIRGINVKGLCLACDSLQICLMPMRGGAGPIHEGRERSAAAPDRVSPIAVAVDASRDHPRDTRTRASALLRELALGGAFYL